ncbi:hypothetical protein FHS83_001275 [Rhizomicrobium palustre]|uniref:Uncharacterized protein n=1 Tax=Rhizomicrobium palustre TaxID=189966 RepID=A0A846MYB0_9PROT|nr:hypothetical protein [Rhizomicrobium palustre]NIK87957.1 hypothetical protein [Rhizomicrobium palustre]
MNPPSDQFASLKDKLLKAGIAPRHVRRYARELDDHFADLLEMQKERGYEEPDASCRARALLGDDEELLDAMLATGKFRALSARAPWLVFGIVPPVAIFLALLGSGLGMAAIAAPLHSPNMPLPSWCEPAAQAVCLFANYAVGPLAILLLLVTALRQRLEGWWPVIGVMAAALLGVLTSLAVSMPHAAVKGEVSVTMGLAFPDVLTTTRFIVIAAITVLSLGLWAKRRSLA